ncbi:MAG: hypothetical protein A2068_13130 [Ignavibacteria bacterium GWB2_35_6b]|nr:MAG: hypothetical protein A2068_13130 [Ignavibacteria bacterium GWB2_35_6b]
MLKYIFIFLVLIISENATAQFRVEEILIKGELTADDPYNTNFGRFDPVELYLNKGDIISISMTAEFPPFIALVAPSEKYYVEYTKDGSTIKDYQISIKESGTWYLSIAGDSTDTGNYTLTANYMSANSITIPAVADYCTILKFLSEHSKVNFYFLKESIKSENPKLWKSKIDFNDIIDSYISEKDNFYYSILFESSNKDSAEIFYKNKIDATKSCLGPDWVTNSKDWSKTKSNDSAKEELFVLKVKNIRKNVKIILTDKNNSSKLYQVAVEIMSKK